MSAEQADRRDHGYALHVIVPPEVREGSKLALEQFALYMARRGLETDPNVGTFAITGVKTTIFSTPEEVLAQPGLDHCDGCREGATRTVEFLKANPGEHAGIIDIVYEDR